MQVLRFLSFALFLFFWLLSLLTLALFAYLSCHGGSMFSFYFVDFLVFFWLIFKCFCFVSTYKSISYFTVFSLVDLLCPFLSILLCKFVSVWPSLYILFINLGGKCNIFFLAQFINNNNNNNKLSNPWVQPNPTQPDPCGLGWVEFF